MNNLYESYYSFRKHLQEKNPRKTRNKYLNLRALDQNEAFLPGVIYSVFDTSEDKPVRD